VAHEPTIRHFIPALGAKVKSASLVSCGLAQPNKVELHSQETSSAIFLTGDLQHF
jgi:hypothetical protein